MRIVIALLALLGVIRAEAAPPVSGSLPQAVLPTRPAPTGRALRVQQGLVTVWPDVGCAMSSALPTGAAAVISGRRVSGTTWDRIVAVVVVELARDREVSESEARALRMVDVGVRRPQGRLATVLGAAVLDWWQGGLQIGVTAGDGDERAVLEAARSLAIGGSSGRPTVRGGVPRGRREIYRATLVAGPPVEGINCTDGAAGRSLSLFHVADGTALGPPVVMADSLRRISVAGRSGWEAAIRSKLTVDGRTRLFAQCAVAWSVSGTEQASLLGRGPCDDVAALARTLAPLIRTS